MNDEGIDASVNHWMDNTIDGRIATILLVYHGTSRLACRLALWLRNRAVRAGKLYLG